MEDRLLYGRQAPMKFTSCWADGSMDLARFSNSSYCKPVQPNSNLTQHPIANSNLTLHLKPNSEPKS